jgi:hypothetical protein
MRITLFGNKAGSASRYFGSTTIVSFEFALSHDIGSQQRWFLGPSAAFAPFPPGIGMPMCAPRLTIFAISFVARALEEAAAAEFDKVLLGRMLQSAT